MLTFNLLKFNYNSMIVNYFTLKFMENFKLNLFLKNLNSKIKKDFKIVVKYFN